MSISEISPGRRIGACRLLRLLGQGNSSEVFLGEHPTLDHPVAVKLLYSQIGTYEIQRFLTQAAILEKLDHPHIVHIYDFGLTDDGTPYLAMSYAPHGTLRQLYPRGTRLPLSEVITYVKQVASALHYVHEHQLVHRDVKPQNMLVGGDNELILSDFGTATISYSLSQHMVDFEGTVLYAAPEQLEGRSLRSSDQYALAVMAYELLTGSWPFTGTFEEVTHKHLFEPPPALRARGIEIALAVEDVLQRALAKEPARRFASVQDFADALDEACLLDAVLKQRNQSRIQKTPLRKQFRSPLSLL